ncbi:hypothetical protein [Corallococcus silvisoli]|uniref:hypothetical protein n=1 Tax=Corallococcus silvisoli TaxID=2697031 RepID=UPI001377A9A7|nr:hypothetical protein [Corallococcus silvisoli]NBD10525.1 hypothetical protein [Corallococcus silvisoli]
METKTPLLQTVLKWPLPQVRAWLDGLSIGEPVGGENFNWDGFAFTAAARAREERSVPWAHIALLVYGVLAGRSAGGDTHSIMLSAMSLRAWMIRELGAQEGDAVLEPEVIFDWFQELASIPIEEAARIVSLQDWSLIPTALLLRLRYIKSALNTLVLISETGLVQKHPELNDWFQLRSRLP